MLEEGVEEYSAEGIDPVVEFFYSFPFTRRVKQVCPGRVNLGEVGFQIVRISWTRVQASAGCDG